MGVVYLRDEGSRFLERHTTSSILRARNAVTRAEKARERAWGRGMCTTSDVGGWTFTNEMSLRCLRSDLGLLRIS